MPLLTTTHIALRIDKDIDPVIAWLNKHGYGGFGVREGDGTSNVHWQFHLVVSGKTLKAVRSLFKRELPGFNGNGEYSMSEVDDVDKYDRYLCKGGSDTDLPIVVWRNSIEFTTEKVAELHRAYWVENQKIRKKRSRGCAIDGVIDICKEQKIDYNDRRAISRVYIKMLGEQGRPINLFSMRANINAVQLALCPDDTIVEALCDRLEQY